MTDLSNDPRFRELPKKWQEVLAYYSPTVKSGEDSWHEVKFILGSGILCQSSVVNGKYTTLSQEEIDKIRTIAKVL